jgi:hypothetical protein
MQITIEQALGSKYLMFYHAAWPVDLLTPVCTLNQCVDSVNHDIATNGKDLQQWNSAQQDAAARLLRVNWIYQRLGVEPIRKPVLTHWHHGKHIVDCGDTRLMALNLLLDPGTVSVVVTVPVQHAARFSDWDPIRTNQDLIRASSFGSAAQVFVRPGTEQAIEWLEIGDHTTAHHLHSVDLRVSMMQNYLDQQPRDFEFSVAWARSYINWDHYANRGK